MRPGEPEEHEHDRRGCQEANQTGIAENAERQVVGVRLADRPQSRRRGCLAGVGHGPWPNAGDRVRRQGAERVRPESLAIYERRNGGEARSDEDHGDQQHPDREAADHQRVLPKPRKAEGPKASDARGDEDESRDPDGQPCGAGTRQRGEGDQQGHRGTQEH